MAVKPTVILDIEGGELGSEEMVSGAAQACAALRDEQFNLYLVSAEPEQTKTQVARLFGPQARHSNCAIEVIGASQKLPAKIESPVDAYRNFPDSAIRVAMNRAKDTPHSVVISPASTGLVLTAGIYTLGRVKGIDRVPIGTPLPARGKNLFFVDGGSNVDCRPSHLYQFAVLAHIYVKNIEGLAHPLIALLSNGSEEYKGNIQVREAAQLIQQDPALSFAGFTEGHTMLNGSIDIMVCDGFLGNILLKSAEGFAELIFEILRTEVKREWYAALAAKLLLRGPFGRLRQRLDYTNFGGAPLLGLRGNVIICHGRSPAKAIKNAILVGFRQARADIAQEVAKYIEDHGGLLGAREQNDGAGGATLQEGANALS